MYELLYTSVATSELSDDSILDILNVARDKNKRLNITGMLIYHKHEFMQLLEGEKKDVLNVYSSIEVDERHTSVEVFHEGPIDERCFTDWSMAFDDLKENKDLEKLVGFEKFNTEGLPINLINNEPNIGKDLFLYLRSQI
jgi:Sensors of blue-light using FAD